MKRAGVSEDVARNGVKWKPRYIIVYNIIYRGGS